MIAKSPSDRLTHIRIGTTASSRTEVGFQMPSHFVERTVQSRREPVTVFFEPLAFYQSQDNKGVEICVLLSRLPREIAAGELGELEQVHRGLELCARRDQAADAWKESSLVVEYPDRKRVGRIKIIRFGSIAFALEVSAPMTCNPIVANAACQIADSLVVCSLPEKELAEDLQQHSLNGDRSVSFQLPESWESIASRETGIGNEMTVYGGVRETASDVSNQQPVDTLFHVELLEKSPDLKPLQVAIRAKERLESQGLRLGGSPIYPIETTIECDRAFAYSPKVRACEGPSDADPRTVGVVAFERPNAFLVVSSVSRSRQASLVWWAVHRRAYQIFQESLVWT